MAMSEMRDHRSNTFPKDMNREPHPAKEAYLLMKDIKKKRERYHVERILEIIEEGWGKIKGDLLLGKDIDFTTQVWEMVEAWKNKYRFDEITELPRESPAFKEIFEIYTLYWDGKQEIGSFEVKKDSDAGIEGIPAEFSMKELFGEGQATIITGVNGSGKTNFATWLILQILTNMVHENPPVVLTNIAIKKKMYKMVGKGMLYHVSKISDIFKRIGEIDSSGQPHCVFIFIDEYDGIQGGNAWTTRSKTTGLSFYFFNQMRKLQGVRFTPILHFTQDINVRYREGVGVHCFIHKGQYFPIGNNGKADSCLRIYDKHTRRKTAGIWWAGETVNIKEIPYAGDLFDTDKFAYFIYDRDPKDLIEMIHKAGLSTEATGAEWYKIRGRITLDYLEKWENDTEEIEQANLDKMEIEEFVHGFIEEGSELQESRQMSHKEAYDFLIGKHAKHPYIRYMVKFDSYKRKITRWRKKGW